MLMIWLPSLILTTPYEKGEPNYRYIVKIFGEMFIYNF